MVVMKRVGTYYYYEKILETGATVHISLPASKCSQHLLSLAPSSSLLSGSMYLELHLKYLQLLLLFTHTILRLKLNQSC